MTTYWLVGEKPINNNVQQINVSAPGDQENSALTQSSQRQSSTMQQPIQQEQQTLCQAQNQSQGCNTRNIITITGNYNGAPPGHSLNSSAMTISPSHRRTPSSTTVSENPLHQTHQQVRSSDNVPNHSESDPNAPLLLPAGSIPRA